MSGEVIEVPVLIAGGGPLGVTLAMDLARLGVKSLVLERRRQIPPNPRCNTTNARSMEIFRRFGCADAVRAAGLPADHNTDIVYMTTFAGHELTRYVRSTPADVRAGTQHDVGANWPTPEPQHFISQLYMEPVLRQHAAQHYGVELREGWEFVSFKQDEDGVTSIARDVDSGEEQTFRSQYLVGADGSNSLIRQGIGARLEGIRSLGATISVFMRAPRLTELFDRTPGWMYRFTGGGVLVAIDGVDQWLLHTQLPPGEDHETYNPEPQVFAAIGEAFDYDVINIARWTPRALVANKFREGRVFVGGDAAHLWVPMGGFGMNAGVADAISISWRLAGVLQGWLDPKVLDSYELERAPLGGRVAAQAAKWSIDLRQLQGAQSAHRLPELERSEEARRALGEEIARVNRGEFDCPGFQLGYFYENSPVIAHDGTPPPPFSLEAYTETSWPGARLPHIWRADGQSLFDQLGVGFTLLRVGTAPPTGEALIAEAAARGLPLVVLDVPEAEAVAKYQGYGLVLVRPDQHVAWRGQGEPDDPKAVLDRVTGVLTPERAIALSRAERISDGFAFGEGARWDGQRLIFSDMIGKQVLAFDPLTAQTTVLAEVEHQPNGLAILPDGRLLIASMNDKTLYALADGALSVHADLSAVVTGYLGDMVVDKQGRVYVDDTGVRVLHGETIGQRPGRLIRVDGPGEYKVVLEDLAFPNGVALSPGGEMLYLAQTPKAVIEQHRVYPDGELSEGRPFAAILADGIATDRAGGVWACSPQGEAGVARFDSAGRQTARVVIPGGHPVACALAGPDQETLYIVGFEPLPPGGHLFEAMAKGLTRGVLWRASVQTPPAPVGPGLPGGR